MKTLYAIILLLALSSLSAREDMPFIPGPADLKKQTRPQTTPPNASQRDQKLQPQTGPGKPNDQTPIRDGKPAEPVPMKGDRPDLPSPGNTIRFEQAQTPRDFPYQEYSRLMTDSIRLAAERSKMEPEIALHREQEIREELRLLFPRGLYRFGSTCPLKKLFSSSAIEFRITCLPDDVQNKIRFARGRTDAIRNAFEFLSEGRTITANLQLLETGVGSDGLEFIFREKSFQYENRFIEALRDESHMTEQDLLQPEWVSRKLPGIISQSYTESDLAAAREVFPRSAWFPFHKDCPLKIQASTLLDGESTTRIELAPTCMPGRTAVVRVSEQEMNDESALRSDYGTALFAEMRLSGIMLVDGRLHLDWDGVRNVRRAEGK